MRKYTVQSMNADYVFCTGADFQLVLSCTSETCCASYYDPEAQLRIYTASTPEGLLQELEKDQIFLED